MNYRSRGEYKLVEVRSPESGRTTLVSKLVGPVKRVNSPAMTKHKEEK